MSLGESRQYRSAVIAAARNSSHVGIAWIGPRGDGSAAGAPVPRYSAQASSEFDNDVYVMTSDDAGVTWNPRVNVTQRADSLPGGWAPHAKATALFDAAGVFHTVWQAMQWQGYGVLPTKRSRLFHWDDNVQIVRTVFDANWNPEFCTSGYNQLNVDNPQLSACDGKLYVTFTYFAPVTFGRGDDCAKEAFDPNPRFEGSANGDLWLTVSDNGGFNWDPPRNLTDSYTPSCDTIFGGVYPDCHSDAWQSATRYGIDVTGDLFGGVPDLSANLGGYAGVNFLFVSYVDDAHPGAAILGEGGWTVNPVRVFRFGCVGTVVGCVIASDPFPEGQAVDDPAHVLPGQDSVITWRLENTANTTLYYSISVVNDDPPGNLTITGGAGTMSHGLNNYEDLTVTLNANLETTPQHAHAEVILESNSCGSP
ncbi:MAG TPA: hypothetical protein VLB27_03960, partial [candidate division Zixibacteria bacterium]|nr:hypothetical protein [candidate division Zixibacteria bacterium]